MWKLHRECHHFAQVTNWQPPKGMDNRLRQFHCSWCQKDFYVRLGARQLNKLEGKEGKYRE